MRLSRFSGLAAAAAMLTVGASFVTPPEPQKRSPRKMPRGYANDTNRKQSRAADRSSKQFLIKGVRP